MSLKEIAKRAQKAQRERNREALSIAILDCYKYLNRKYPREYFGAVKIDNRLGLEKRGHSAGTHNIINSLKLKGFLEQAYRRGFRLKTNKKNPPAITNNKRTKMTDQEIRQKAQNAQEDLFSSVLEFYKAHPNKFYGSKKVTNRLGLLKGYDYWFVHAILDELKSRGELDQIKGRGFIFRKR